MAERRTSVRLAVVGGNEVRAELMAIGADGQRSLEGIGRGAQTAGAGLRLLDGNAAAARQQIASLRGQTGNLAAQFQDIGVQLAGGQSPFLIALQQGGQISQVLGPAGARGAVAALGAAFASLVSPVSLATIGIVAAGGVAIQYFSTLLGEGEKSAQELKEQADLIGQVARKWGDAVPALQAYVDELERAKGVEDLRAAGEAVVGDIFAQPRERARAFEVELANVVGILQSMGAETSGIAALQDAFHEFQRRVEDATVSARDAEAVQEALISLISTYGVPAVSDFAAQFDILAGAMATAAGEAARVRSEVAGALNEMRQFREADARSMENLEQSQRTAEQTVDEQERRNALTREQLRLEDEIARIRQRVHEAGGIIAPGEAERLARETIAAEERRAAEARGAVGRGGGGNAELREANKLNSEAERIIRSVRTATEEYNATLADLKRLLDAGAISQEVYARATAEAGERLAARTAAEREAALAVSGDPFEGARAGMQEYAEETLSTAEMIKNSVVDAFSAAENAVGDFVRTGKLEVGSLVSSIIADMAQLAVRQRVLTPLANWLGGLGGGAAAATSSGGGGGLFSSLISGIGKVFGGGRASGGPVVAGVAYLVGEGGRPELFVPDRAGQILPMDTAAILRHRDPIPARGARELGSGGGVVQVNITTPDIRSFRQSRAQVTADIARAVNLGRRGL